MLKIFYGIECPFVHRSGFFQVAKGLIKHMALYSYRRSLNSKKEIQIRYFVIALWSLVLATPVAAMDWLGPRCPEFVKSLQQMVKKNERERIAKVVSYPLTVDGKNAVPDQAAFIKAYDSIFTKDVRECVAKEDTSHNLEAVGNSYMIGRGCVWFDKVIEEGAGADAKRQISILSVNTKAP